VGDSAGAHRPPRKRVRTLVRGLGQSLLTAGLVAVLFVAYEFFVTDLVNDRRQDALSEELRAQWNQGRAWAPPARGRPATGGEVPIGSPFAVLYIPRLGSDYRRVVVEGTAEAQLAQGPGHYPGTAMPGQPGNVAIAGHRVGKGSPFLDLDRLRPGDPIVLEVRDAWFVYRVLGNPESGNFVGDPSGIPGRQVVNPGDVEVIAPTPNEPSDAAPSGAYLTLTTCHPRFSARQRLVVHAALDGPGLAKAGDLRAPDALHER
jgi:sortase (surface protein transpeptidase)